MKVVFFVSLLSLLNLFHPVHVSLVSLSYDGDEKVFNLFMKVFSDDLELDCRLMTGDKELMLYDETSMPDRKIISQYVNSRLRIEAGGEKLEGLLGKIEADSEEVRIEVLYRYSGKSKEFRIVNTIMTDLHNDQANLLIFTFKTFEEGYRFSPGMTEVTINTTIASY